MAILSFIKPTFGKLLLAIIGTALASFFMYDYLLNNTFVCLAVGCPTVQEIARNQMFSFFIPLFLVLGYVFSCSIMWGYGKIRGR